jgi:hypothetical protein
MDIIAHALWTTAAATVVRRKLDRPIHLGWAAFWGVFPDLISFTIPAVLRVWWRLTGASNSLLPEAHGPHFEWVWGLYNCSHSALIFAVVFATVWLFARRPVLELSGWFFHISIDIFTHRGWFATQFLWPVSSLSFNGIPWETGWFLVVNYAALTLVFLLLWRTRTARARRKHRTPASG